MLAATRIGIAFFRTVLITNDQTRSVVRPHKWQNTAGQIQNKQTELWLKRQIRLQAVEKANTAPGTLVDDLVAQAKRRFQLTTPFSRRH